MRLKLKIRNYCLKDCNFLIIIITIIYIIYWLYLEFYSNFEVIVLDSKNDSVGNILYSNF